MVIFNSYVSLPEGKGPFMVTLFTFQGTLDASFFRFVTCVFDEFSSLFLGDPMGFCGYFMVILWDIE